MNEELQAQQPPAAGGAPPQKVPPNGLAIAGFITAFFCGIVGLILSIKARKQIDESGGTQGGRGFTTGGIIVSIINLVMIAINVIATVAMNA